MGSWINCSGFVFVLSVLCRTLLVIIHSLLNLSGSFKDQQIFTLV